MKCDICGANKARVKPLPKTFGKGKDLILIENVPVVCCANCGESYLTAETLHEIERLKLHRNQLSQKREINVINFV